MGHLGLNLWRLLTLPKQNFGVAKITGWRIGKYIRNSSKAEDYGSQCCKERTDLPFSGHRLTLVV